MAHYTRVQQPQSNATAVIAVATHGVPAPTKALNNDILDAGTDFVINEDDTKSETSTIRYEHECFETFQHKVAQTAAHLGRDGTSIHIERMKGGNYNRVVGIEHRTSKPKRLCFGWAQKHIRAMLKKPTPVVSEAYVFRTPRNDNTNLKGQVATLTAVGARLRLPIPEIVHYDLSSDNVVGKPFMIQKRISGRPVSHMLEGLNLEQRRCVTKYITELVSEIASVQAAPGGIAEVNITTSTDGPVFVNKFPVPRGDCTSATPQRSIDHLLEQCETWREFQTVNGYFFDEVWDGFAAISKALETRGFLDGPCVLIHGDFREYNLLEEVRSHTEVEITGIID
jgi:hypothetical protein